MKTWEAINGQRIIQILSGRSNVFLVTNGEKNFLVDTGPKYMWELLEKRLNRLNINHIDYLILTHSHFDHAANSNRIKEKYKASVIVHKNEASYLVSGEIIVPDGTNFITHAIVNLLIKPLAPKIRYKSCRYDFLADEKFDLNDFGFNAYIMHTPGHTPGSVSIIVDNEIALVGDTMFGVFKGSVFPPFACDIKEMITSWEKLLETNCYLFLPSHGSKRTREQLLQDYNKRK